MDSTLGRTTSLSGPAYLIALMLAQREARLTDEELLECVLNEFPHMAGLPDIPWIENVRRRYNRGVIVGQKRTPKQKVPRYGADGKPLARKRPLPDTPRIV